jgi:hypothetical protein
MAGAARAAVRPPLALSPVHPPGDRERQREERDLGATSTPLIDLQFIKLDKDRLTGDRLRC